MEHLIINGQIILEFSGQCSCNSCVCVCMIIIEEVTTTRWNDPVLVMHRLNIKKTTHGKSSRDIWHSERVKIYKDEKLLYQPAPGV